MINGNTNPHKAIKTLGDIQMLTLKKWLAQNKPS